MGYHIIKQDDDKYAVFTSVSDTLLLVDAPVDELIEWWGNTAKEQAIQKLKDQLGLNGNRPYPFAFSGMSFKEAVKNHMNYQKNCRDPEFNALIAAHHEKFKKKQNKCAK